MYFKERKHIFFPLQGCQVQSNSPCVKHPGSGFAQHQGWRRDGLYQSPELKNVKCFFLQKDQIFQGKFYTDISAISLTFLNSVIGHLAHIVGAVVGLLVGLVLLRNRRVEHWQTWVRGTEVLSP